MIGRSLAYLLLFAGASSLYGQAKPTASRTLDLQIGAGFITATTGYEQNRFLGIAAYGDFDFKPHLGIEAEFHQVDSPTSDQSFQRTYEIGPRYFRTYGPFVPYAKAMIGRGDFNYPFGLTDLSYTLYAAGAGADLKVSEYLHLRAEYEFQSWFGFSNGGLRPQLVTIGAAYHFNGRLREK